MVPKEAPEFSSELPYGLILFAGGSAQLMLTTPLVSARSLMAFKFLIQLELLFALEQGKGRTFLCEVLAVSFLFCYSCIFTISFTN